MAPASHPCHPPTIASEPVAGYDLYLSWTDDDGVVHTITAAFALAGSNSYVLQNLPDDVDTVSIMVVAVDASGNEGAYPIAGTPVRWG